MALASKCTRYVPLQVDVKLWHVIIESLQISRSILVDVEAAESDDEVDDWDDEAMAAERARQAAESVPLRRRDGVDEVLEVARRWEAYAMQGERTRQPKPNRSEKKPRPMKRKELPNPPATPRSQKRARTPVLTRKPSPSPPPPTNPVEVETCSGTVIIHVPVVPGESELLYETRIYDLSIDVQRNAERVALAMLRGAQASVPPPSPEIAPEISEEWPRGALTPTLGQSRSPSPVPLSSRIHDRALSLDGDLDPDELEVIEDQSTMNEEKSEEEIVIEERQTLEQKLLGAWVASNYSGTATQDYQIFAIRCMVSPLSSIT